MRKTVKVVSLEYNQEFFLSEKRFVYKGRSANNGLYTNAIYYGERDARDDKVYNFGIDLDVEIEVKQVRLLDIVCGQKFKLDSDTVYTKLQKIGDLVYMEPVYNKILAMSEDKLVSCFDSDKYVYPL